MIAWDHYQQLPLDEQIDFLYQRGKFIMGIRYYNYKINLYLLNDYYLEVFINHKNSEIERICLLDSSHSRMKFYSDQIKLPTFI